MSVIRKKIFCSKNSLSAIHFLSANTKSIVEAWGDCGSASAITTGVVKKAMALSTKNCTK